MGNTDTMTDQNVSKRKDMLVAQLAAMAHAGRRSTLLQRFKRAPKSLGWRLSFVYQRLKRDAIGLVHRLQRRRIVHMLHIGKTGGTAIKAALKGYERAGCYELILHPHEFVLKEVPFGEKVVFFVRDPISRFASGFYGRQRQDAPRHHAPWTPDEEIAFHRFKTPNELALALSSDDQERRDAAVHAIQSINHLNAPHWVWFTSERYLASRSSDILFIGFQHTLRDDFALLKNILDLPEDVSLPDDEVGAHRNPDHLDKHFDKQAIRNLEIWYARDYQFLEFCKNLASQIRSQEACKAQFANT